jgi:sulfite reductase alpha subunit-like flavoprotein
VSTLERTHLDSSQLLERVRLLEGRLGSISSAPLSPFNQAELLARVQALEGRAAAAEDAAQQLKFSVDEVRRFNSSVSDIAV